ncbi:MAG TPA: enoyl-CoA hydratase-related protein [Desulfomonilaceae bacterium]|nr:enoyl-CoA hydratase-related protein [Desulfomonilaceae bacterium]
MNSEHRDSTELVAYERDGNIGIITLNRPDKRNALSLAMWNAIGSAVDAAAEDADARVILLKGEGKSFCAGLDLSPDNEIIGSIVGQASAAQKMNFYTAVKHVQQIHTRLERLRQPTIALIHGHCLGAGLELVLCCDIRLCSEDATFALPEARLAIITDVGGLQRLPKVVGQGHAREIVFRGHTFDAARARSIQLVNDVFPTKEILEAQAREMAVEIAANPPLAVQGSKDVFLYQDGVSVHQALEYTAARSSMIMPSEDLFEAMSAHLHKRKGQFKGA